MKNRTLVIGELGTIVTGRTPSSKNPDHFGEIEDYPFFTPTDLNFTERTPQTARFISEQGRRKFEKILLPKDTIVYVCIGATIGKLALTKRPSFTNQQINSIVPSKKHDARFVYYKMSTMTERIKAQATGSATPIVNKSKFSKVKLQVPPLPTQHRIADILSAYDDLIENNNRRMALLEESIHLLYREWFVYLRFPGHEHTKIVDGVPEGWERGVASDLVKVQSGRTPKTTVKEYWNGNIPFFTPKDAPQSAYVFTTEKFITNEGLASKNMALYPKNSIFITARGTVGKLALAERSMAMNQSCYCLQPVHTQKPNFIYPFMREVVRYLRQIATGGVFDTIIVKTFDHVPVLIPPQHLIHKFELISESIYLQLKTLSESNRKLRGARDLLLPRLMDGRIMV